MNRTPCDNANFTGADTDSMVLHRNADADERVLPPVPLSSKIAIPVIATLLLMVASDLSPAHATGGEKVSVATTGTYRLNVTTVAGRTVTARWNPCGKAISYSIDSRFLHTTTPKRRTARTDVRRGIRELASATGLRFREVRRKDVVPTRKNWTSGKVDLRIVFMSPSHKNQASSFLPKNEVTGAGRYAGFTRWMSVPSRTHTGDRALRISKAVIAIDGDQYRKYPGGYGPGPVTGDLLLHELGHSVGLDHVNDSNEIMYGGRISNATYPIAAYQAGDLNGLSLLGRQQGCLTRHNHK